MGPLIASDSVGRASDEAVRVGGLAPQMARSARSMSGKVKVKPLPSAAAGSTR